MQNIESWEKTRFIYKAGKFVANKEYVFKESLFVYDLLIEKIQQGIMLF